MFEITILFLAFASASVDPIESAKYADRTLVVRAVKRPPFRCMSSFVRSSIRELNADVLVDLDAAGNVIDARLTETTTSNRLDKCIVAWVRDHKFDETGPRGGTFSVSFSNPNR